MPAAPHSEPDPAGAAASLPAPSPVPSPALSMSVVVAVLNEADNVDAVCAELFAALPADAEAVFVDDGSTDGTADRLRARMADHPRLRLLRHDQRRGKSAAIRTGVLAARAPWIATMDGDGQNDPADLPVLLAFARAHGAALVAGVRAARIDSAAKRWGSRLANRVRLAVLADDCPDTGCGVKLFQRDAYLALPHFEGMHRFLPALFRIHGHHPLCHPVRDRARLHGRSKYTNLGRAAVGIGDLLGVVWLRNRTRLPEGVSEERG